MRLGLKDCPGFDCFWESLSYAIDASAKVAGRIKASYLTAVVVMRVQYNANAF